MPASPQPQANAQPPLAESPSIFGGPGFGTPSPEPAPAPQQQSAQAAPAKKTFFLDWLIN
jgi:hypothetical protein